MTSTRPIEGVRPADKVLQALATLAALIDSTIREVKSLDNEFQSRLLQAVHATEVSLQAQTAEHVERAKQEVQEDLKAKFQVELQSTVDSLKSEFESEREKARESALKAVHETEVLLKGQAEESLEHAKQEVQQALDSKYQQELQAAITALKAEFEIERSRLNRDLQQVSDLARAEVQRLKEESAEDAKNAAAKHQATVEKFTADFEAERSRLNKDLQQTTELASRLQADGSALMADIQRVRAEAIEEAKAAAAKHQNDLQSALETLKAEFEIERGRLNKELQHSAELASKLQSDGSGLAAEIDRVKTDSAEAARAAAAKHQTELQSTVETLKAGFEVERGSLNKELQRNVELAANLQADGSSLMAEVQRVRTEASEQASAAVVKHQKDLESALDALKSEFAVERERLNKDLLQKDDALAKLAADGEGLTAQMQQLKSVSAAELERSREEAKAAAIRSQEETQTAIDTLKAEFDVERTRLNKELSHTVEAASKLEAERTGLISEVQKVKSDSAAEVEKARQEAKAAAAKAAPASGAAKPAAAAAPSAALQQEIEKAEARLQELLKIIENPTTELSTVIRKNVEKSETEAYLRGIRLVLSSKA